MDHHFRVYVHLQVPNIHDDEGEGVASAGSIVAAYPGQHGWYWLNLEADPITITLEVAGDYNDVVEINMGGD